jgi:hypothetical protein
LLDALASEEDEEVRKEIQYALGMRG